jgi:hypothetical protein
MLNQTNNSSGKSPQYEFGSVRLYFDPDQVFRPSVTKRPCNKADFDSEDTVTESAIPLGSVTAACERAVQALRDVRHLLPADGAAIVDAVLDHVA